MEEMPLGDALEKIAAAGYDGFEAPLEKVEEAWNMGVREPSVAMLFEEEIGSFRTNLQRAADVGADAVNVHAGKDWWTFDQGCAFFEDALGAVEEVGLPVTFETHRGRLLFEPQSTLAYLRRFPALRLTADLSHWTCVCESMLRDQNAALDVALERTGFIHARVGHEEGPQVPDPRSPYWARQVEQFDEWWDRIRDEHLMRGETTMNVDPEFGPPNYMWTDDGRPLADVWDVCLWMRDHLRDRWAA
jgi:sugar phosphate isomerase/epimerase